MNIKITSFKKIKHLTPNACSGTGYSEPDLFEMKYIDENGEEFSKNVWIDIWYYTPGMIKSEFTKCMRNRFGAKVNYNFDEAYDMYLDQIAEKSCPYTKEEILNAGLYR